MEEQNPTEEKSCPWCQITFYGDTCPQCGWAPWMLKCPTCGTYFKGDVCPQCLQEHRDVELQKRKELLNEFKSIKYCRRHENYYLGEVCPKCVEQDTALVQKEKHIDSIKSMKLCEKCGSFFVGEHCSYCGDNNEACKKPLLPLTFSKICLQCGMPYSGDNCPTCGKKDKKVDIPKEDIKKAVNKKLESENKTQVNKNVVEVHTVSTKQDFATTFMFVVECFFGVALFLLFLLPVMKADLLGNEFISYNLYEFIEVFSKDNIEWSNEIKTISGCSYAVLIVACICILISIYSIAKAVTDKTINKHNIMTFVFLTLAIIAIVMIVNIKALDNTAKNVLNDFNVNMDGNIIVGGGNEPLKDIYKVGALPIVLLVTSIVLFIVHFFDFIASSDSTN